MYRLPENAGMHNKTKLKGVEDIYRGEPLLLLKDLAAFLKFPAALHTLSITPNVVDYHRLES